MKLSFTKINTFNCPYRYKAIYIDNRSKETKSDAIAIGEGIHTAIEYLSLNPNISWQELENIYIKKCLKNSSLIEERSIGKNLPLLKNYYASGKVLVPLRILGRRPFTEVWFNVELINCSVVGKIDIITENLSVVDYKTSSKPFQEYEAHDVLSGKGLQLSIYALAYYQMFRELPKKVGFQVILKNSKEIQHIASTRTMEHLKQVKEYITNIANSIIKETEFKPKYGCPDCVWCEFKTECRKTTKKVQI